MSSSKTAHRRHCYVSVSTPSVGPTGDTVLGNLHFTDDIDVMGGTEKEAQELTPRLEKHSTDIGHVNGTENNMVMVSSRQCVKVKISK